MERATHGMVLETKLIPPKVSGLMVRRQRLLSKALLGMQSKLVLVDAPAGYGKTSVLAQVHRMLDDEHRRVAWLSLDEADNDLARFLSHLVVAIQRSGARFGASTVALLGSGAPLPAQILRTSLLNEIAALEEDLHVFLDDYHVIKDPEVRETIVALLAAPLTRLHLMVASRGRNDLRPLGKMRALGHLTLIDGAEMAFSDQEASDFLGKACKVALAPEQAAALCARTEGWVASLQLACIALEDVEDVCGFLESFSGETSSVEELLVEEVLQRLSPDLQKFLIETSILTRFTASLAEAVTACHGARRIIDEIEAKNLFLFSLDNHRTWYRYHHLFADVLRRRLEERGNAQVSDLHRRAAAWLAENDYLSEAIEHAFLGGQTACAGALLERASGPLFAAGQIETLQRQFLRLPTDVRSRLPRLQLELGWGQELEWRFREARATLDSARDCLSITPPATCEGLETEPEFLASKLAHREMMLLLLTDRLSEASAHCVRWRSETPSNDPFMVASVGTALMVANRELYSCDGAPAEAARLRDLFVGGGAVYGTVFHDCATGTVLYARGDLVAAEQAYERARRCAIDLNGEKSRLAAMPTAMLAELCYERGELARASALLALHVEMLAEFGWVDNVIARFVTASRLAFAERRFDDASDALEAGQAIAEKHGLGRLRAHLLLEQLRQLTIRGDSRAASLLFTRSTPRDARRVRCPSAAPTVTEELVALKAARMATCRGEAASAIPALKKWLAFTRDRRIVRSTMRVGSLLANAQAQAGDVTGARRTLIELVTATSKAVFVRSLIDEGPTVVRLLTDLLADHADSAGDTWQRLSRVLVGQDSRAPPPAERRAAFDADAGEAATTGPLSPRELQILRLSAQGMATSDICRVVNLSENTVKWYWSRIFAKLQVHRRFDAIKAARQQRLLA